MIISETRLCDCELAVLTARISHHLLILLRSGRNLIEGSDGVIPGGAWNVGP